MNQDVYDSLKKDDVFDFSLKKNVIILGELESKCKEHRGYLKDILRKNGWTAMSIDMSEKYPEALKIDLAKPIPIDMKEKFDLLLDFGTGEHIRDQNIYWKNCHELVRKGGKRIHALPYVGSWKNHCVFRYTTDFFKKLSEYFEYDIIRIEKIGMIERELVYANINKVKKTYDEKIFIDFLEKEIVKDLGFKDSSMFCS